MSPQTTKFQGNPQPYLSLSLESWIFKQGPENSKRNKSAKQGTTSQYSRSRRIGPDEESGRMEIPRLLLVLTKRSWGQKRAMKGPHTSGSSHFTSLCPFRSSSVRLRAANTGARGAIRIGSEFEFGRGFRIGMPENPLITCAHELAEESSLRVHGGEGGGAVEKP